MPRILLVEDDAVLTKILTAVLENASYAVDVAGDGLAAIELLETEPIDAVVTDLIMPRMSGRQLCELIRSDSRWCALPLFVVTGASGRDQLAWLDEHAGIELFKKPIRPSQLVERLDHHLRPHASS